MRRRLLLAVIASLLAACGLMRPAAAQTTIAFREDLDFDRPESWAMKYYSSVALPTGLGVPRALSPGSLELGLEVGWVPSLSEEERRVGFYGTKVEDLNRTSVFGRPRLSVGLPAKLSLTVGWVPPVELDGVETNLVSLALARPLREAAAWRLGLRLYGQGGTVEGDITCERSAAAAGDDPERNPFGCLAPSEDELTLTTVGLELGVAFPLGRVPGLEPYAAVSWNHMDNELQVNARYGNLVDRTLQVTSGDTFAFAAGAVYTTGGRIRLSGELFYAPLDVQPAVGEPVGSRDLFNVRALLTYRLR